MDINEAKAVIKGLPLDIPINLRGAPGIGKTFGIHQLAEETGARCHVFLACTMDPTDMSGIPMRTPQGFTEFAPPYWAHELSTESDYKGQAVAFFDDLPTADEHVQASFFRMVHERQVGRYKFRDNVRIISAGNRVTDKAAAKEMPTPLRNRFCHLDIDLNAQNWAKWAIQNGLHGGVVAFLRRQPDKLNDFNPKKNQYAFATPRSWHNVSKALQGLKGAPDEHFEVVAGLIGEGITHEFVNFWKHVRKVKSPEAIIKDPEGIEIPAKNEIDVIFATISGLGSYIAQNPTPEGILASFKYSFRISKEFGVILGGDVHTSMLDLKKVNHEDRLKIIGDKVYEEVTDEFKELMPS